MSNAEDIASRINTIELLIGSSLGVAVVFYSTNYCGYVNSKKFLVARQFLYKDTEKTLKEFDKERRDSFFQFGVPIGLLYAVGERIARRRFKTGKFNQIIEELSTRTELPKYYWDLDI